MKGGVCVVIDDKNDLEMVIVELARMLRKDFYRGNEQFKNNFFACMNEETGSHNLSVICEHIIVTKL